MKNLIYAILLLTLSCSITVSCKKDNNDKPQKRIKEIRTSTNEDGDFSYSKELFKYQDNKLLTYEVYSTDVNFKLDALSYSYNITYPDANHIVMNTSFTQGYKMYTILTYLNDLFICSVFNQEYNGTTYSVMHDSIAYESGKPKRIYFDEDDLYYDIVYNNAKATEFRMIDNSYGNEKEESRTVVSYDGDRCVKMIIYEITNSELDPEVMLDFTYGAHGLDKIFVSTFENGQWNKLTNPYQEYYYDDDGYLTEKRISADYAEKTEYYYEAGKGNYTSCFPQVGIDELFGLISHPVKKHPKQYNYILKFLNQPDLMK